MKIGWLILSMFFWTTSFAQLNDTVSVENMKADLTQLHDVLWQSHPNLYAYTPQEEVEAAWVDLGRRAEKPLAFGDWAQAVAQFLAVLKDSHTSLVYAPLMEKNFKQGGKILPIRKRFDTVVKASAFHLVPGDQLISIDTCKIEKINSICHVWSYTEGNAEHPRKRLEDALFTFTLTQLFGKKDSVEIAYIPYGDHRIFSKKVALLTEKEWKKHLDSQTKSEPKELDFQFSKVESLNQGIKQIARLNVRTFNPHHPILYRHRIRKFFRKVARLNQLEKNPVLVLLDLRGNGGGLSTNVEYLYAFLDSAGHNTPSNIIAKRSPLSDSRFKTLNRKSVRRVIQILSPRNEDLQQYLHIRDMKMGEQDTLYFHRYRKHRKHVYSGPSALFIDGLTASAGVDFTRAFVEHQRGEIWGEPCMGSMSGTFGNATPCTLKNTKLTLMVSTIRYNYNNRFYYELEPIYPTHLVQPSLSSISEESDLVFSLWLTHIFVP